MGLSWSLLITSGSAVVTTLLGVLVGGFVGSRSQRRHWSRDRQAEACAQVLRESSNVLIELAAAHRRRLADEPEPDDCPPALIDWRPWNEALAMVCLVADHEIVEAARAVDAEIWNVDLRLKAGLIGKDDWHPARDRVDARRTDFVGVVRRRLGAGGPPLRHLTGRPSPDDPVWALPRPPAPISATPAPVPPRPDRPSRGPIGARSRPRRPGRP